MNALARVLGALLLFSGAAQASTTLTATLTTDQEVPPAVPTTTTGDPRPIPFGNAVFVIDDAMTSMSFGRPSTNIDFTGTQTADINDNLTVAHIHGPAAPGATTGVIWGFFGSPFNDDQPERSVFTPFATGVGGTISGKWDLTEGNGVGKTFADQIGNILAGLTYMNFHTTQFGSGEIRGQIVVVPEPETYLLMLAGLAGIGASLAGEGPQRARPPDRSRFAEATKSTWRFRQVLDRSTGFGRRDWTRTNDPARLLDRRRATRASASDRFGPKEGRCVGIRFLPAWECQGELAKQLRKHVQ